MKRKTLQKSLSVSLLAVLAIQPFVSVAHADLNIKGNTTSTGGIQIKSPVTIQLIGSPTVEGTVTVTGAFTIVPEPGNIHSAFQHASYLLKPTAANPVINFGGVTTGLITIGNTNVGPILGADGISRIEYAPGVTPGNAVLRGPQLDAARTGLENAEDQVDIATAAASQTAFVNAKGDQDLPVYQDVTAGVVALQNAKTAAESTLANKIALLSDLSSAAAALTNAQDALDAKVDLLKDATQQLVDQLSQAKADLSAALASINKTEAQKAKTDYVVAGGLASDKVYDDLVVALTALDSAQSEGQGLVADPASTLADLKAALTKAISAQTDVTNKTNDLKTATKVLQARASLNAEISLAESQLVVAGTSQTNYETALGDKSALVYTDAIAAKQDLKAKIDAGQLVHDQPASTFDDLNTATTAISDAKAILSTKVTALNEATNALIIERNNAKQALAKAIADVNVAPAQQAQNEFDNKGGKRTLAVYTDVTAAILTVQQAKSDGQAIDPAAASVISIKEATTAITNAQADLDAKVDALKNATGALVMPAISSKELTKFNFSTVYSGPITLVSKVMTTSSFKGSNQKHFTINDGPHTVKVDLTWDIPQNEYATTYAASIGSAVESHIQQHFLNIGGVDGLMNRTMGATVIPNESGQGDTFKIFTFGQPGIQTVTLGGPDWQYFFDQNIVNGPNEDKSAHREFSISDGTNTATFKWESNLVDMAGVVQAINANLSASGVKVTAVQVTATTFQLVGKRADITITVDGANKGDLFTTTSASVSNE